MSSSSSSAALLVSLASLGIYGYSAYFIHTDTNIKGMDKVMPSPLRQYGQYKFLTYQCLLIQTINAALHILAHFSRSLVPVRDFFFTCLAYPVGSIVVYTFWAVWHLLGREMIFPTALSQFYPDWLNHATHSLIVPVNFLLLLMLNHRYIKRGVIMTLLYFAAYISLLFYIKHKSGVFVYRYLDTYGPLELLVYFAGTAVLSILLYKSGQLLTGLVHGKASQRVQLKKSKLK